MTETTSHIDLLKWERALDEASEALDVAFDQYDENDTEKEFNALHSAYLAFMERVDELDSEFWTVCPTLEEFRLYRDAKERVEDYTRAYFSARGSRKTIMALRSLFLPNRD